MMTKAEKAKRQRVREVMAQWHMESAKVTYSTRSYSYHVAVPEFWLKRMIQAVEGPASS